MKKVFITSIVALALILAGAASANAAFTTYLTVGSKGADVTALQTWLISKGFDIPAISSGAAAKGYFGQQTKAAVVKYQASVGLPSTGFVGPLTIAKLNGAAGGIVMTPVTCPIGYTCTPAAGTPVGTPSTPGVISTPGAVGSITNALWSSPSGVEAYKGQSYDIVGYKVQASGSDMALQNFSVDFDTRLWLYASAVTVKDDMGAVVGQVNNLSEGNFSHLTVGTQERLIIPVNGYVVKANTTRYLTVNITFLPSSDRSTGTVTVLGSQIRAIDGTGVADTESSTGGSRTFHYNGSGSGSIVVTTDPGSPATGLVQVSTTGQTNGVLLAKYDIKSQNAPSTLRSLSINVQTSSAVVTPTALFSAVQLMIGNTTYSANTITTGAASTTYVFSQLTVPLPADQYVPVTVLGNVAVDTSGTTISGTTASTTLIVNTTTVATEDASYATVSVNAATFNSNTLTFTSSSVSASNLGTSYGTAINNNGTSTQQFTFTFSLTAGNNPIYVSKSAYMAVATSTANPSGMTVSALSFYDNDTSGDSTGSTATDYFYVAPGQTKTFNAVYSATGLTSNAGTIQVNAIKYGTSAASLTTLTANSLNQSTIQNALKAVLYH